MPNQSMMPSSQSIWNALLTVLGVALLACLGWQMSQIAELKEIAASRAAVEFTEEEANELRRELTDVVTSIDIRLTLIERDIEWIKIIPGLRQRAQDISGNGDTPDPPPPPQPSPSLSDGPNMIGDAVESPRQQMQEMQTRRYDLRK
jgi:hypothetical protein